MIRQAFQHQMDGFAVLKNETTCEFIEEKGVDYRDLPKHREELQNVLQEYDPDDIFLIVMKRPYSGNSNLLIHLHITLCQKGKNLRIE